MVGHTVKCEYCKKSVARVNYGKHLLSHEHREEFLKDNKDILIAITKAKTPSLFSFSIKETICCICLTCKKHYVDADESSRDNASSHFERHPKCKEGYIAMASSLLKVKTKKPVASSAENEKLQKELKRLRNEVDMLQCTVDEGEESSERLATYTTMLVKIFGDYGCDDEELERRFTSAESEGKLPLFT